VPGVAEELVANNCGNSRGDGGLDLLQAVFVLDFAAACSFVKLGDIPDSSVGGSRHRRGAVIAGGVCVVERYCCCG
jgi:hypothetical protein